jgi:endonuclease YncB( thermonuclease family)
MQVIKPLLVKILSLSLLIPPLASGVFSYRPIKIFTCKRVIDGDTAIFTRAGSEIRLRFAYIDAPESKQYSFDKVPIGKYSKEYLAKLIEKKKVKIQILGKDLYGRSIGEVFLGTKSVNEDLVESGFALFYHRGAKNRFKVAQFRAQIKRIGIWETDGFINPWLFRKKKRQKHVNFY